MTEAMLVVKLPPRYNKGAGKRILWENILPLYGDIDCDFNEKEKFIVEKKIKGFILW